MTAAIPGEGRVVSTRRSVLALAGFVVLCFAAASVAGWATSLSVGTWYPALAKPWFTPPDGVFGPVWTALYLMMALAAWRAWRSAGLPRARVALALFGVQLALNLAWSVLFFGLQAIGWALVEIVVLWIAIAATTLAFWRLDRPAAVLMLPYLAWVTLATALTAEIWRLN